MTPQQIDAMKLALEALELTNRSDMRQVNDAITALEKALAQEQDGQCKKCKDGCPACDARKLQKEAHDLL